MTIKLFINLKYPSIIMIQLKKKNHLYIYFLIHETQGYTTLLTEHFCAGVAIIVVMHFFL